MAVTVVVPHTAAARTTACRCNGGDYGGDGGCRTIHCCCASGCCRSSPAGKVSRISRCAVAVPIPPAACRVFLVYLAVRVGKSGDVGGISRELTILFHLAIDNGPYITLTIRHTLAARCHLPVDTAGKQY